MQSQSNNALEQLRAFFKKLAEDAQTNQTNANESVLDDTQHTSQQANIETIEQWLKAASATDKRALKKLLNERDGQQVGQPPLHHAVNSGNNALAELLIQYGAKVDEPNVWKIWPGDNPDQMTHFVQGRTALQLAILRDNIHMITLLLANGANIQSVSDQLLHETQQKQQSLADVCKLQQQTPLHCAVETGNPRVIQLLLEEAAKQGKTEALLNAEDRAGETPLQYVIDAIRQNDKIKQNSQSSKKITLDHSEADHLGVVALLLEKDPNKTATINGLTVADRHLLLQKAIEKQWVDIVKLYVTQNIKINDPIVYGAQDNASLRVLLGQNPPNLEMLCAISKDPVSPGKCAQLSAFFQSLSSLQQNVLSPGNALDQVQAQQTQEHVNHLYQLGSSWITGDMNNAQERQVFETQLEQSLKQIAKASKPHKGSLLSKFFKSPKKYEALESSEYKIMLELGNNLKEIHEKHTEQLTSQNASRPSR